MRKMVWAALLGAATMATAAHAEPVRITVTTTSGVTSFDFDSQPTPVQTFDYPPPNAFKESDFYVGGMDNGQKANLLFALGNDISGGGYSYIYGGNRTSGTNLFLGYSPDSTFGGLFDVSDPAHPSFNSTPATYTWTNDGFTGGPASLTVAPGAPGPEVGLGLSGVLAAMTALVLTRKRRAALA